MPVIRNEFSAGEEQQMRQERRIGLNAMAQEVQKRNDAMTPLPADAGPVSRSIYDDQKAGTEDGEINGLAKRLSLGKQT